uniref:Hepatocyte growth factor-regulated tyrosine kinase substrate n=1 Tax=Globodera rostochiensis TaxID=31243 RepID=A0A914I9L2_GLORO
MYKFQRSLELATDQTLVEPNWEVILECVDMIRGGEIPVKEALKCIQKRYHNANPHISHHALLILEACVKNCGKKFIREVATKEFMDDLKSMVISNPPEKIRDKLLELIQCWTSAFKGIPEFKIFLPIDEAKAMFLADCAPDWAEGENCYRCRVEFGVFTRKHHCRACGQIFCDKCSNKQMLLPQFGIEKKVRVCEACFDKSNNQTSLITTQAKSRSDSDIKSKVDDETREKARKDAEEKEQEELHLALAISQSEAEAKERDKWCNLYSQYNGQVESDPPKNSVRDELSLCMGDDAQEQPFDSMLAKYLDRDYWERKRRETEEAQARATAPPPSEVSISVSSSVSQSQQPQMNGVGKGGAATTIENNNKAHSSMHIAPQNQLDSSLGTPSGNKLQHQQFSGGDELSALYTKMDLSDIVMPQKALDANAEEEVAETSEFCRVLKERVDTLNTRMRSNQLRGRSIVNDSAIHSLFSQLSDAHGKVLERMNGLEGKREHYERLQDHLAHIGEAKQAVDALREENERQRQEMQRAEQDKRQTQLKQKLELMRHKKHEMLLNERQVAIQRFQHNERQILHQRMMNLQSPQNLGTLAVHNQQQQIAPTAIPPQHFPTQNAVDQPNQQFQVSQSANPQHLAQLPQGQFVAHPTQSQHPIMTTLAQQQHHQPHHQMMMAQEQYAMQMPLPQLPSQQLQHQFSAAHLTSHQQMMYQQVPSSVPSNVTTFPPMHNGQQHYPMHTYAQQQYIPAPLPLTPNPTFPKQNHPSVEVLTGEQTKQVTEVPEDLLISFD